MEILFGLVFFALDCNPKIDGQSIDEIRLGITEKQVSVSFGFPTVKRRHSILYFPYRFSGLPSGAIEWVGQDVSIAIFFDKEGKVINFVEGEVYRANKSRKYLWFFVKCYHYYDTFCKYAKWR